MLKCWGVFRDTSRHLVAIWGNLEQGQVYSKKWKWLHYEGIIAGYWLDGWNNFTSWDEPLKNHNCSKNLTNRGSWKLWKGATPDTRCDFLLAECSATHPFYDLRTCLLHSRVTDASILTSLSPLSVCISLFCVVCRSLSSSDKQAKRSGVKAAYSELKRFSDYYGNKGTGWS